MSYVYKLINLYADAPNVYEYYTDFIESKIPNNSAKIKNEVDNDLIYKYFEGVNEKKNPKAPAKQEQVDDAPFDVDEAVETTSVSTIRKEIQPGFYNHGFLSKEDEKIILDEAIKQTNQQGYPVKSSVVYAHWGNMWAVTDKGADAFPVFGKYLKRSQESAGLGKGLKKIDLPKSNIQHNDGGKGWYDYYPTDQNGVPLPPIPQVVKDILEKKLGMDMSVYDSAIINSYGETTELSRHIDNTEDKGYAYKIPIVSISLIGDSIFQYSDPSENPNHSLPDKHAIGLKPGQVVVFGGPSRAMAHRVLNGRSGASVNIKNSVGYLKTERINITLRRALPLSKEEYDAWMRRSEELKQETPPTPAPTPLTSMSEITNHSGGAALSDTEWDQIGREYGVINHFHYREPLDYIDTKGEPAKGSKTLDSKRLQAAGITPTYISQKDYDEGAAKATKAFRMMYKDSEYKSVRSAYIIRNWMQVKNADAVFAIGTIKQPGENASDKADETRIAAIPIIKGGTGYAVQMAINEGKPVYVFDGTKAGWYKYDYNSKTFVPTETPTLTKNFAGIGSRTLGTQEVINKSIQAIRDVYEKTKNSISTAPTAPVSTQLFDPSLPKINIYAGTGENAELSNFANRPFISSYHGDLQFNTVEGAYQSAKLNFTNSKKYWESPGQITNTTEALFDKFQKATGSIAKSLGQTIEGLDVKKWDANSSRIMKDLLKQSFEQNPQALQKLLATGNAELTHTQESPKSKWRTEFPKLLMEVRQELREVSPVTETKTFEEFGTQYRFTLENGVAVKGEFKQGGKDWQEMNAKNVGKKYAELSQKPVVKTPPVEEPPVSIGENTFTFSDGTVINTGNIKLNAQQEVALQLAVNAINRKQTKFVLSGYAGTGKSTISKFIREYLQQSKSFKNIVYSSPTHKANVNLLLQLLRGKIFNVIPSTVATVLNKRKIDNEWVPGPRNKMPSNGVLIVDESSMINDEDYRLLTNLAKSKNSSIIFMGDPAQLPPVSSNEISKAMQFSTPEEGIELTQVMRQQGDNPLLDVLTNIRDNLKSKTDTFSFVSNVNSKGEGISFTKDFNHFNEKINEYFSSKEYKEDPTYAKILTYTNASVANYNDMIQNLLGLEPYSPNSIMMGYEQVGTSSMINNGQDYIILNSEYVSNQPVKVFKGNILNRSFDIQSEVSGYKVTLRKVFSKEDEEILLDNGQSNIIVPIEIFIINPNDDNNIDFMKKVLSFKQVLNDYTIPWSARENAVTEFENFFNIYQFPADMINYKGTITTLQKLKEDNPKLFKLNPTTGTSEFQETGLSERTVLPKNIDYGYAVTSHKGQGSTYKYIFADLQNMDNPANLRIIKDKGKDFAIERQQLKYVGLSRASVEVFAYTRKTNESTLKEGKVIKEAALSQPSAFDLLTEFTPERKQEILSNFAYKHKMTIEKAKDYINEAIATKGKEIVIAQLNKTDEQGNKCY
jgi:alkylated DNA repair dioxygenase AlkB/predicted NAD-dependent protein-ADP-ribosyltransferase YbiA (DUF1768 family)